MRAPLLAYSNGDTARLLAGDPVWLSLIKAVVIFAFLMMMAMMCVWAEQRVIGRMQNRLGPNLVGRHGMLQAVADALKLVFKEELRPTIADKAVFLVAPILIAVPAFLAFAVTPFGPQVSIFGHQTTLQLTDLPVGVLLVLATASVGVYGIVLGGWSSGSPYPLLGGVRAAAQVISYEVALGLSVVAVTVLSGSLSTGDIVGAQERGWFAWMLPVSFVIYLITMVGETNRAPFDLPEGESELVGGFHTEYSSMKFMLFFLAEYTAMTGVAAFATTLFLGDWRAPWPVSLIPGANAGWLPLLWFLLKLTLLLFGFVWLRGSLPRLRYDQFMRLGWKVLIPVNLVWIVAVLAVREVGNRYGTTPAIILAVAGGVIALALIAAFRSPRRAAPPERAPVTGGGYPVPPQDLRVPPAPPRRTTPRLPATEQPSVPVSDQ